jgi:hypothetical protein
MYSPVLYRDMGKFTNKSSVKENSTQCLTSKYPMFSYHLIQISYALKIKIKSHVPNVFLSFNTNFICF